jgi:hypothetical protein
VIVSAVDVCSSLLRQKCDGGIARLLRNLKTRKSGKLTDKNLTIKLKGVTVCARACSWDQDCSPIYKHQEPLR